MKYFLASRFYAFNTIRHQLIPSIALLVSSFVFIVTGIGLVVTYQRQRELSVHIASLLSNATGSRAPAALPDAKSAEMDLPPFSSVDFANTFNTVAVEAGIPVEEIVYVLEDAASQPYLRYRLTFPVKAGYPQVRKFLAALAAEFPNVLLDTVRCSRDDATPSVLACELGFSALFSKENRRMHTR